MKVTVNRFEEGLVVLIKDEGVGAYDVPHEYFSIEVHEGDVLDVEFESDGRLRKAVFLEEETRARRERAAYLMAKLKKKK